MNKKESLETFYTKDTIRKTKKGWAIPFNPEKFRGTKLEKDLLDGAGKVVSEAGTKMTPRLLKKLVAEGLKEQLIEPENLIGLFVADDIIDQATGEVYLSAGDEITKEHVKNIEKNGQNELSVLS